MGDNIMDNDNKVKVESLDDTPKVTPPVENHIPKVTLPPNANHVPKVTLPPNVKYVPKVTLPQNEEHVPKVVLPPNMSNVPKVTLPQNEEHVPKVVLPEKTKEPSNQTDSQDRNIEVDDSIKSKDTTENPSDNKKKINNSVIIISVAVIAVVALVFAYSKGMIFSNKEKEPATSVKDDKPSKPEVNKVAVDVNSVEVVSMFSKFKISNNCLYNPDLLNNDNLTRLRLAYENIDVKDFINVPCSNSSCNMNPEYCGESMTQEMQVAFDSNNIDKFREAERKNTTKAVTASVLEAKYKELFGSDSVVIHESFGIGGSLPSTCRLMKYESDTVTYYLYNSGECSNICSPDIFEEIKEAYKIDENLFIVSTYNGDHTRYDLTYEFRVDPETQMFVFKSVTKH